MRYGIFVAAAVGFAIAVYLVLRVGAHAVFSAVVSVGWSGFFGLCLFSLVLPLILGSAWYLLVPGVDVRKLPIFALARQIRDSASDILPFSQFGGIVIGVRVVVLRGLPTSVAFASSIVDITSELMAQIAFIAIGTALCITELRADATTAPLVNGLIIGLGLMVPGTAAFILLQRRGSALAVTLAGRFLPAAVHHADAFKDAVGLVYRDPVRLAASATFHLLGWITSGVVTYIAIRLVGGRLGIISAIAIESLLGGLRSATAFVPASIGVQEAGYAALMPLFGLGPEIGLAVSLLRRARDIAVGVPVLLLWQSMEGHRAFARAEERATEP